MTGHRWVPIQQGKKKRSSCSLPWPRCARCGLVRLHNAATQRAISAGCEADRED